MAWIFGAPVLSSGGALLSHRARKLMNGWYRDRISRSCGQCG